MTAPSHDQRDVPSLVDACGRHITHLRISVTQRCNLSCMYCHREGEDGPGKEMSLEWIVDAVGTLASFGVSNVKITGGEPLVRRDIVDIVRHIAAIDGVDDVSMTTNGHLLPPLAAPLREAGLHRLNIGCDAVTERGLPKSLATLEPALASCRGAGFDKLKVNMVVLEGVNVEDIEAVAAMAWRYDAMLQLIELIPMGVTAFDKYFYPLDAMEERLRPRAREVVERSLQGRRQYHLEGGVVEVVNPSHTSFCKNCRKIRITSDGRLKPCLLRSDNLVPYDGVESIREAMRRRRIHHD